MILVNEVLFLVILIIAIYILCLLIRQKDGYLRKVMIGYFGSEIWVYAGFLFCELKFGDQILHRTQVILFVIFSVKALSKIIFFLYLMKNMYEEKNGN